MVEEACGGDGFTVEGRGVDDGGGDLTLEGGGSLEGSWEGRVVTDEVGGK